MCILFIDISINMQTDKQLFLSLVYYVHQTMTFSAVFRYNNAVSGAIIIDFARKHKSLINKNQKSHQQKANNAFPLTNHRDKL